MPSYAHTQLIEEILRIDALPSNDTERAEWIKAGRHVDFLQRNALSDEMAVYASGPYSFIMSIVVPNEILFPLDKNDLLQWNGNPFSSTASYVYSGGREDVWVENTPSVDSSEKLRQGKD